MTRPSLPAAAVDAALLERVRRRVAASGSPPTAAVVASALREDGALRGDTDLRAVVLALQSEIVGAGPLEPLLRDPRVTDVLVCQ